MPVVTRASKKRLDRILFYIVFGSGVVLVAFAVFQLASFPSRSAWPKVDAEVVELHLRTEDQITFSKSGNRNRKVEFVDFRFEYQVAGLRYVSSCFYDSCQQPSFDYLATRYRVGTKFQAHYDPKHPQQAFVESGSLPLLQLFFGLGCIACAWLGFYRLRVG